jgi:hypothetical protein
MYYVCYKRLVGRQNTWKYYCVVCATFEEAAGVAVYYGNAAIVSYEGGSWFVKSITVDVVIV